MNSKADAAEKDDAVKIYVANHVRTVLASKNKAFVSCKEACNTWIAAVSP